MNASPDIGTYFFTQGILGVVVLVLAWGYWKKDNALQAEKDARLQDAKETTKDVATVVQGNTQAMNVLTAKIDTGKKEGS